MNLMNLVKNISTKFGKSAGTILDHCMSERVLTLIVIIHQDMSDQSAMPIRLQELIPMWINKGHCRSMLINYDQFYSIKINVDQCQSLSIIAGSEAVEPNFESISKI